MLHGVDPLVDSELTVVSTPVGLLASVGVAKCLAGMALASIDELLCL